MMHKADDAAYYRGREVQELEASKRAMDATIKRLHWEIAQRYAFPATEAAAAIQRLSKG